MRGRSVRCQPAIHSAISSSQRQRAARAQDVGRPLVHGGGARRVGAGQVVEQVVEAGRHSSVQGSASGRARPATSSSARVGGRGPALVDPAEQVAVAPAELGLGCTPRPTSLRDDDGRAHGGRRPTSATSRGGRLDGVVVVAAVQQVARPTASGSRRSRGRRRRRRGRRRGRAAPRSSATPAARRGGGRCGRTGRRRSSTAGGDERHRSGVAAAELDGQRALAAARPAEQQRQHQPSRSTRLAECTAACPRPVASPAGRRTQRSPVRSRH